MLYVAVFSPSLTNFSSQGIRTNNKQPKKYRFELLNLWLFHVFFSIVLGDLRAGLAVRRLREGLQILQPESFPTGFVENCDVARGDRNHSTFHQLRRNQQHRSQDP